MAMRIVRADIIRCLMTYGSDDACSARAAGKRQLPGHGVFGVPIGPYRMTTLVFWHVVLRR